MRSLSGGERNRLLMARLFARPANVLVLDEPTNDLDIDTLELLEELLSEYKGTVFLVSHDRRFVDNVATSIIAWEGDVRPGQWREYEGNVEDWLTQRARSAALQAREQRSHNKNAAAQALSEKNTVVAQAGAAPSAPVKASAKRKLSYKEQRELDMLPPRIAELEAEQVKLQQELADGTLYARDAALAAKHAERVLRIDEALLECLERWETLSA